MKLSAWAKKQGISYMTAWKWHKAGTLPVKSVQLSSGTILVDEKEDVGDNIDILNCAVKDIDSTIIKMCEKIYGKEKAIEIGIIIGK